MARLRRTAKLHCILPELHYEPLLVCDQQVRLVLVHPGSASDPVRCSFVHTILSHPFDYEAISYAWGSTRLTHLVFSGSSQSAVPVTASANAALRSVRHTRSARLVWIDGLCINQSNQIEKAQQVGMMGHIYGKAQRTLVYLGEDDDNRFRTLVQALLLLRLPLYNPSWLPLDRQHSILRATRQTKFNRNATLDHVTYVAYLAREMSYGSQDDFKPLMDFRRHFFARSWFKRLWIMQEIALSKQVTFHFAGQTLPWGTIMAFYNLLDFWFHQSDQTFYGHPVVSTRSILGQRVFRNFNGEDTTGPTGYDFAGESIALQHRIAAFDLPEEYYEQGMRELTLKDHLFHLMYEMRHYGCGDARDKLYAILSLFREEIPEMLRPAYDTATTVSKVYTSVSRCLLELGNLDVLAAAHGLSDQRIDLPSWAIDWEALPHREDLITSDNLGRRVHVGTKEGMTSIRQNFTKSNEQSCVVLRGMALGKLTCVGPTCPQEPDVNMYKRVYSCWIYWSRFFHSLEELGIPESALPNPDSILEHECYEEDHVTRDPYFLVPDGLVNIDNRDRGYRHWCQGRAFATVGHVEWDGDWEKGWCPNRTRCLVPHDARIGDVVSGLLGSDAAVVLQPIDNGMYRFVGISTCSKLSIAEEAPDLDWNDLMSHVPQVPLQDFRVT